MTRLQKILMLVPPVVDLVYSTRLKGYMQGFEDGVKHERQARELQRNAPLTKLLKHPTKLNLVKH